MKTPVVAGLVGVAAFAAGCATVCYVEAGKVQSIDDKFTGLARGLSFIKDNIDLNIPEEAANAMINAAANEVAIDIVKKAAEACKKEISTNINQQVKNYIAQAYTGVEKSVTEKLEKEINIQTIERIENRVSEKVAKQILSSYTNPWSGTSKADIAKACIDNGMDGFDVARVMQSIK